MEANQNNLATENQETKPEATATNEPATNDLQTQVTEAETKLKKLNDEIKDQNTNKILNKLQVKSEFHDYVKFKTNSVADSELETSINKMLKENPALKIPVNTGGVQQTVITNKTPDKTNPLLDYKKKNHL